MKRTAARAFPNHKSLALIGDSDRRQFAGFDLSRQQCRSPLAYDRAVNFLRIVFDPPWARIELMDLAIGAPADTGCCIDHDCCCAGRSLIYCENQLAHSLREAR